MRWPIETTVSARTLPTVMGVPTAVLGGAEVLGEEPDGVTHGVPTPPLRDLRPPGVTTETIIDRNADIIPMRRASDRRKARYREMVVPRALSAGAILLITPLLFEIPIAAAQPRIEAGTLTCRIGPGVGALIASRRQMTCFYRPREGRRVEQYSGTITRFGFDVGITAGGIMSWVVLVRTTVSRSGALAGHYIGASGEASFGLGPGAKALIGGSRRSTVLQPFSVAGQVGVNFALGVAGLTLRYKGSTTPEAG